MTKKILITLTLLLLILTGCNSDKAFKGGYAIAYKDGTPYLLNSKNETYDLSYYDEVSDHFDEYTVVKKYKNQKLLCGYINRDGVEVIKTKYEQAYPFSEGYAVVVNKGIYQLIDTSDKVVYTFPSDVKSFGYIVDGHLRVEKDGKFSFLRISDFYLHDQYYEGLENFSDGYALYHYYENNNKYYNFLNKEFKKAFEDDSLKQYEEIEPYSNGFSKVKKLIDNKYYYSYMNTSGNLLIDENNNSLFEIARSFSNGKALVFTGKTSYQNYYTDGGVKNKYYMYQYLNADGTYVDFYNEKDPEDSLALTKFFNHCSTDKIANDVYFYDFIGNYTFVRSIISGDGLLLLYKIENNILKEIKLTTKNHNLSAGEAGYHETPYILTAFKQTTFYDSTESVLAVVKITTNYCGIINSNGEYLVAAIYDRIVL